MKLSPTADPDAVNVMTEVAMAYCRQTLKTEGQMRLRVRGSSMRPFLCDQEEVIVKPADFETIRRGDIVLTFHDGVALCHRVFRKTSRAIQTKADARPGLDPWRRCDEVVGIIVGTSKRRLCGWGSVIVWLTFAVWPLYCLGRFTLCAIRAMKTL